MTGTIRIRYGRSRHQAVVLHPPAPSSNGEPPSPMVVLVHGGFWRWPYNRWLMWLLERDLVRRGWGTCNVSYRRLGRFGGGGGWPATFDDVRSALETVSSHELMSSDTNGSSAATMGSTRPLVVVGHSAGGHLALVAAATVEHRPSLVIAMAAPTDLERLSGEGSEPVDQLTSAAPEATRWALTSPMHMLPIGVPVVCVHGADDTTVRPSTSTSFVTAACAAGDVAAVDVVPGETHRDALRPSSKIWQQVVASIVERLETDVQV